MHAKLALTAIAGFLIASVAFAQSSAARDRLVKMDRHFAYTDKNGDGFIARDEAAHYPALIKHFDVIDSDSDGKLSREEMQAYRLGTHGKQRTAKSVRKKKAEDNGDGALTKANANDESAEARKNF
ncbi:MAG: hypothetical protein A3I66_07545 [Burkholderiales bacterium RIFCSPLOWO2_02_FULL_57_36]|nr:MAG: hypothetical protein A3I66_07545 [Burkholderiales bacterium RIFCSPLOWO2_02_FULL_57_36]